jgi:acyl-CoA reductase-like NAD-dependent aldehyde dehydrogenase
LVNGTSGRFAEVFEPKTGEVQAKVALASKVERRAAVENTMAAQVDWGATNPQRRARVMMKFLELAQRDYDELADLLARKHDKPASRSTRSAVRALPAGALSGVPGGVPSGGLSGVPGGY